jgi:KRAB domain-containing zinc finger protein
MFASSCTTIIKTEFQDQPEETEQKPEIPRSNIKDHICPICHEEFPNYSSRERHRRKVHGKVKKVNKNQAIFSCAHCPSTFGSRPWMLIHMNSHRSDHEMRKFECHHCPKWYRTKRQIREHLEIKHFPKKEVARKMPNFHTCGICSGVYYDRHEYQTHLKSHEELDNLECAGCKKKFKSIFVYIRHVQTQKELHTCTKCDAAFHSKGRLDKHMRLQHNESYVCEICDLPLYTRRTFEVHQQVRHGISIKSRCKHCGETYESREKLKEHVKAVHPDTREKPLVCEQCGKAFPTEHDLKLHLESHSEKLECQLCHKKLKNSDTLANHMKNIHSGRKTDKTEYPCPKCPLLFERRQYLEGHMIVHNTDNRPFFQCTRCGIAYTRRQKLQAHVGKCPKKDMVY